MLTDEAAFVGVVCCEIGVVCSAELSAGGKLHRKADCFASEPITSVVAITKDQRHLAPAFSNVTHSVGSNKHWIFGDGEIVCGKRNDAYRETDRRAKFVVNPFLVEEAGFVLGWNQRDVDLGP